MIRCKIVEGCHHTPQVALGVGYARPRYSIDLAYQLRWAENMDSGNIIATSAADITEHTVLASLIYYF